MRLQVDYTKQIPCPISRAFVVNVLAETLRVAEYSFLTGKNISVTVAFVSSGEIRRLNKTYRQKDKITDVLSFPEYDGKKGIFQDVSGDIFLGELILCYDYIKDASEEDGVSLEQEMAYILSHGLLHLLGFDHSEEMFSLQDTVSEAYANSKGISGE